MILRTRCFRASSGGERFMRKGWQTVEQPSTLVLEGRPFSAHEVFEARWKDAPEINVDEWGVVRKWTPHDPMRVARARPVGSSTAGVHLVRPSAPLGRQAPNRAPRAT